MYEIYFKKTIFPYGYLDSFEKIKKGLPSKEKFYNTLTNRNINDKNYDMLFTFWKLSN